MGAAAPGLGANSGGLITFRAAWTGREKRRALTSSAQKLFRIGATLTLDGRARNRRIPAARLLFDIDTRYRVTIDLPPRRLNLALAASLPPSPQPSPPRAGGTGTERR